MNKLHFKYIKMKTAIFNCNMFPNITVYSILYFGSNKCNLVSTSVKNI